jgi:hypothetical protein
MDNSSREEEQAGLDRNEEGDVSEHRQLPALVIYEVVRRQGKVTFRRTKAG